jgi:hypothetical protein
VVSCGSVVPASRGGRAAPALFIDAVRRAGMFGAGRAFQKRGCFLSFRSTDVRSISPSRRDGERGRLLTMTDLLAAHWQVEAKLQLGLG